VSWLPCQCAAPGGLRCWAASQHGDRSHVEHGDRSGVVGTATPQEARGGPRQAALRGGGPLPSPAPGAVWSQRGFGQHCHAHQPAPADWLPGRCGRCPGHRAGRAKLGHQHWRHNGGWWLRAGGSSGSRCSRGSRGSRQLAPRCRVGRGRHVDQSCQGVLGKTVSHAPPRPHQLQQPTYSEPSPCSLAATRPWPPGQRVSASACPWRRVTPAPTCGATCRRCLVTCSRATGRRAASS
jgi:hypothetical protein